MIAALYRDSVFFLVTISFHGVQKKQHTIVKSSTESEYHSLAHSTAELSWIFHILRDLHIFMAHTPII